MMYRNRRSIQARKNWGVLFLLLVVTTSYSNVTGFATPKPSVLMSTRYRGVCVRSNLTPEPSSNLESTPEKSEGDSQNYSSTEDMSTSEDDDDDGGGVTLGQGIRVGLYRLLLLGSAGACTGLAVLPLLEGSGLSSTDTLEMNMSMGWKFMLGAAAILAPLPSVDSKFKSNLPFIALSCVGASTVLLLSLPIMFQESMMETATQVVATMATLGICVREVVFYGAAYKVEAIILASLFLLQPVLPVSNIIPGGIALALLVLSFGKLLEPLEEDLRPGQSTFLARNALSTTRLPLDETTPLENKRQTKPPL
eukprot:scaffold77179_cov34-Attheya_sp.AAC.1